MLKDLVDECLMARSDLLQSQRNDRTAFPELFTHLKLKVYYRVSKDSMVAILIYTDSNYFCRLQHHSKRH